MKFWDQWTKTRVVMACAVISMMAWALHGRAIAPLSQSESEAVRDVADLRARIEIAQKSIAEIRAQEKDASHGLDELEQMRSALPAGAPMVWFPPMAREHFAHAGLATPVIRLSSSREDPHIPDCDRGSWLVRLPIDDVARNIAPLLLAVADLDQQNPFVRVLDFAIRPDSASGSRRSAVLRVAILSPKAKESQ